MAQQKKTIFNQKLSVKISAVLFLFFTLFVLTISTAMWNIESSRLDKKAQQSLGNAREWAQKVFAEPVWSYDKELISELTKAMLDSPEKFIISLKVLDRDGDVLSAGTLPAYEDMNFTSAANGEEFLYDQFPVMNGAEKVGEIQIVARPHTFIDYLRNIGIWIWGTSFVMILFLGVTTYFTMERLLARPFRELIQNMQQVESANYQVRLKEHYSAELEELAESFRNAIESIGKRDRELQMHAQNLEKLVDVRTKERDQEKMKVINASKLASLGEVSAGIAHEINNPLAVIEVKSHLIRSYLEKGASQEFIFPQLDRISAMVQRITRIIKSLKYFSRDASADPGIYFSLRTMISEVQTLCSVKMSNARVRLTVIGLEQDYTLNGREVQLSQVLVNLVQNAIHAVEHLENPEVFIEISDHSEDQCRIAVVDNGSGIPENIKDKIFQPFFTTKGVGQGTGLGLSISYGIIKQHGGELVFARENNRTVFSFVLPARKEYNAAKVAS